MDLGLAGKTALVCGASSGLGRAIALELAREGADLVIVSRSADRIETAAEAISKETQVRVDGIAANLSVRTEAEGAVEEAIRRLGHLDILITNTGGPPSGPFEAHDHEVWSRAIAQNLESVVNLVRTALPGMKERAWGRIVNVTSISVKQPVAGLILSNTLRAGVTGFAKTIANEAGPFNVTVNNVLPGYTLTDRLDDLATASAEREGVDVKVIYHRWKESVPMGRLAEPDELAALTAFLCSERAGYITGQSIAVDGGWIKGLF